MSQLIRILAAATLITTIMPATSPAQITQPRVFSKTNQIATLQERLINRLRATTEEKKAYIHRLVGLVRAEKLPVNLVLAIERKAVRRRPVFPFPYFEQAIKFEAAKRKVIVPTTKEYEMARAAAVR